MLAYDLERRISLIGTSDNDVIKMISDGIVGMELTKVDFGMLDGREDSLAFSVYRRVDESEGKFFQDAFDVLPRNGFVGILFLYAPLDEVDSAKKQIENVLSEKKVRETESFIKGYINARVNSTAQRELYHESEERMMLSHVIESVNNSILSNGLAYKIFVIVRNEPHLREYVETHFLVTSCYSFNRKSIRSIADYLSNRPSLPFGTDYAKEFVNFYGFHAINHSLVTCMPLQGIGIPIGKFVREGVLETDTDVNVNPSAINLGFIMTGLPGSGKTREAMSVIDSVLSEGKETAVFVITPTNEWMEFASSKDMFLIRLYGDNTPINFFRCPDTIETEKFYGNLAMILSSAANAGPYRNPMEKCMLNAFRKVYSKTSEPDPVEVYNEIEESIIRYHGKRTGAGIKYTKHGENIKSALENLRGILSRPQYCVEKGLRIEDLIKKGAVFDVSEASAETRTQLYALVLNQIYALTSSFDAKGDNELRLLVCLEEAQTIFGDEDSPAVKDVKQRIQDFRKQGIGLILLTHNVTDIDIGIRRLCQLKLYMKQSPDTAIVASKDLIFSGVEQEDVVLKLKTLSSQIGAFSYVSKDGVDKRQQDTIFIKTKMFESRAYANWINPLHDYLERHDLHAPELIKCRIAIKIGNYKDIANNLIDDSYNIEISFLGEEISKVPLHALDKYNVRLMKGKGYTIAVLNGKNKVLRVTKIAASETMYVNIGKSDVV